MPAVNPETQEPTIIRSSSLADFADCARRGAARIFRAEIIAAGYELRQLPFGIAPALGSAVHKAAEVTFDEKARSGALPPASLAIDCAADHVKESIKLGIQFDGDRGTTRNADAALHQVVSMTRAYHRVIAPHVEPVLIEGRLMAEVSPGLILSGQPDIVAREPNTVRDLKTSAKKTPGNHNYQLGSYAILSRTHGYQIDGASIDHVQRVRPDKPQPDPTEQRAPVAVAEAAAVSMVRHIDEDLRIFREGDARQRLLPGNPAAFISNSRSFVCGERYCPAYGLKGERAWCRDWEAKEESE